MTRKGSEPSGEPDTGNRRQAAARHPAGRNQSDAAVDSRNTGWKTDDFGVPTVMLIRIFGKKDREPYGDILHSALKKPVPYQSAAELVLRIDAISRSLAPSASGDSLRSIRRTRGGTGNTLPEECWNNTGTGFHPKVRDTIYLQLIGRQHTSLQGRIWGRVTRKKYISFRSALELIYLLSEAV